MNAHNVLLDNDEILFSGTEHECEEFKVEKAAEWAADSDLEQFVFYNDALNHYRRRMSVEPANNQLVMPFSGHSYGSIKFALHQITSCDVQIEVFDCFLKFYLSSNGDLSKSIKEALREWDC